MVLAKPSLGISPLPCKFWRTDFACDGDRSIAVKGNLREHFMQRIVSQVVVSPVLFFGMIRNPIVIGSRKSFAKDHHLRDVAIRIGLWNLEGIEYLLRIPALDAQGAVMEEIHQCPIIMDERFPRCVLTAWNDVVAQEQGELFILENLEIAIRQVERKDRFVLQLQGGHAELISHEVLTPFYGRMCCFVFVFSQGCGISHLPRPFLDDRKAASSHAKECFPSGTSRCRRHPHRHNCKPAGRWLLGMPWKEQG